MEEGTSHQPWTRLLLSHQTVGRLETPSPGSVNVRVFCVSIKVLREHMSRKCGLTSGGGTRRRSQGRLSPPGSCTRKMVGHQHRPGFLQLGAQDRAGPPRLQKAPQAAHLKATPCSVAIVPSKAQGASASSGASLGGSSLSQQASMSWRRRSITELCSRLNAKRDLPGWRQQLASCMSLMNFLIYALFS